MPLAIRDIAATKARKRLTKQARRLSLESLEPRRVMASFVEMLGNLDPRTDSFSGPTELEAVGNKLFFVNQTDARGAELWVSSGTRAGTDIVKDIYPGTIGASPSQLTNVNGTLYFIAQDETRGRELWKSDGTLAGTTLVKDIMPGTASSNLDRLTAVGNFLYFIADDGVNGTELWKSNGTASGTRMVKDLNVGDGGSTFGDFGSIGNTLYFTPNFRAGFGEGEPWVTDGTAAGTRLLRDILPGTSEGNQPSNAGSYTNVKGTMFFVASTTVSGNQELWKTDGTSPGTILVREIEAEATFGSDPKALVNVNGTLFLTARDNAFDRELWKSSGTAATTSRVKNIAPNTSGASDAQGANVNGLYFFIANDGINGLELWKSDGTSDGTEMVEDLVTGGSLGFDSTPWAVADDILYFVNDDGTGHGFELLRSDGTVPGTKRLTDLFPDAGNPEIREMTNVNGTLYFTANNGVNGREIWRVRVTKLAPSITTIGGAITYRENAAATQVATTATIADPDTTDFEGALLTVSIPLNATPSDALSIRNQGTGPGQVSVIGNVIRYGSVPIATMEDGQGELPLVITFGPGATKASVQAVTRMVNFRVIGDAPSTETRVVRLVLTDPDGVDSAPVQKSVAVQAVNDPPVFALGGTISYTENSPAKILTSTVALSDVDSPDMAGGEFRAQVSTNATADDRLEIRNEGTAAGQIGISGNSVSYGGVSIGTFTGGIGNAALLVSLNAASTPPAVQALTRNLTFRVLGDAPSTLARTVTISVADGDGGTTLRTKNVTILTSPDAPRLAGTGSIGYALNSPSSVQLAASAVVADPDTPFLNGGELNIRTIEGSDVRNQLAITGNVTVTGNQLSVGGTNIGSLISDGKDGQDFTVRLNNQATVALVQQLLRSIRFSTTNSTLAANRKFGITVSDGTGGTSNELVRTVVIS